MKNNLTKQEAKEMNFMKKEEAKQEKERALFHQMKKSTSLKMILDHYRMDVHWRDNDEEENEMTDTLILATDYVRELEEIKKLVEQGKLRKSNCLN